MGLYFLFLVQCLMVLVVTAFVAPHHSLRSSSATLWMEGMNVSANATAAARTPSSTTAESFVTAPTRVFIEDTDAYGIVYNGNYLKFYDRALLEFGGTSTKDAMSSGIVAWKEQKFRSSPALGQPYVIRGTRCAVSDEQERSQASAAVVWDLEMTNLDGSVVYNSIHGLVWGDPYDRHASRRAPNEALNIRMASAETAQSYNFTLYRDELEAYAGVQSTAIYQLPLRSVLNYFERPRSNMIGGPDDLMRLNREDGIVVVVTSIENCRLLTPDKEGFAILPGQTIQVDTEFVAKKQGMLVECLQTVRLPDSENGKGAALAQGVVKVMMLDSRKRRPTKRLPGWLKAKFGLQPNHEPSTI